MPRKNHAKTKPDTDCRKRPERIRCVRIRFRVRDECAVRAKQTEFRVFARRDLRGPDNTSDSTVRHCAEKVDSNRKLLLAVECKSLRSNFPLLVSTVPRTADEAFHEIIRLREGSVRLFREVERVAPNRSIYRLDEMVGKQTDQVGRTIQGSELFSDDSSTFDKISQAINSSRDVFVSPACESGAARFRIVVPVLVVPSDVLCQVEYNHDGDITKQPHRVDEATLYINHLWTASVEGDDLRYQISHLHIITVGRVERALKKWMGPAGFFSTVG